MYYSPPEQMIPLLKLLRLNPVKFCGECVGVNEYYCTKAKKHVVTFIFKGNEYNPYRLKRNTDRGISRLLKQIKKLRKMDNCYYIDEEDTIISYKGADYLIRLDLTFPEKYRKKYEKNRPYFEKIMNKCAKRMERKLSEHFGGHIFLWENNHVWKTEKPCGVSHPHLHTNFLNVAKTDKGFKRFSPFISRKVLDKLWFEVLNEILGYEWELMYFEKRKGAVYKELNYRCRYIKTSDVPRLRHRFKYCARHPVHDFFDYYAENVFREEDVHIENCKYLLTEFKSRRKAYGLAWKISRYVKEVDEMLECPACDGKLVHESTWSIREFRDQGFWEKYDYFILYLRGGKIAIYPIIHPEKNRKKIERDKIEDAPKMWNI